MQIAIAGNDARFSLLRDMLCEDGAQARLAGAARDLEGAQMLVAKYPLPPEIESGLAALAPGATLLLLPAGEIPNEFLNTYRVRSLADDEAFACENAVLTSEGALNAVMSRAPFALAGENVMVIGYGRIGRALTEMLVGLRARAIVVSRRESGRLQAMARGARAADIRGMRALLPDARAILVTTPDRVLDSVDFSYISRSAILIDLSSAPHGVDVNAARGAGLQAFLESALPGRYCPESAARALYRAVSRAWTGGERA